MQTTTKDGCFFQIPDGWISQAHEVLRRRVFRWAAQGRLYALKHLIAADAPAPASWAELPPNGGDAPDEATEILLGREGLLRPMVPQRISRCASTAYHLPPPALFQARDAALAGRARAEMRPWLGDLTLPTVPWRLSRCTAWFPPGALLSYPQPSYPPWLCCVCGWGWGVWGAGERACIWWWW